MELVVYKRVHTCKDREKELFKTHEGQLAGPDSSIQTRSLWREKACLLSQLCPLPSGMLRCEPSRSAHACACAGAAIHRAAGPELLELCQEVKEVRAGVRCPTGSAVTTGYARGPAFCGARNYSLPLPNCPALALWQHCLLALMTLDS